MTVAVPSPSAAAAAALPAPRTRRHVATGGGVAAFHVAAGDRFEIVDAEGRQPGLLFAFPAAAVAPGAAERAVIRDDAGDELEAVLGALPPLQAAAARAALARSIGGPATARRFALFGPESPPGAVATFGAEAPALCLLVAPGAAMAPEAQDAPTELLVEVRPLLPLAGTAPPPLAEPLLDLRIEAATASAFRVKAGDYIQIVDVDGKQCSDFLAFDANDLSAGVEFGIDPTTTRTLMGNATPGPGLHSRYYDARMRPLVEVVRDTVGRHDTFMLACTAKYYEDMGYPGHANCSDNFNRALAPYGVAERMGWPAINFFYNTSIDAANNVVSEEPWSRPGDYVLLRALTDLVCASSSCADDVDPANAWEPTDIQVRVYDGSCNFSKGIAHRMTPDAEPRLTRETGFHPRTAALTRRFVDYRGYWLADCYAEAGPIEEYWACRERAVVMDLSPLRKFELLGPDAEALVQRAVTRDIRKLAVGQVTYTAICAETGGMLDDATVFRLAPQNFRIVCGEDSTGLWLRELAADLGLKAWVKSSTDQLHNIAVQGPASRDVLKDIVVTAATQPSLAELKWFRFTIGRIAGMPVVISRTGYTGEIGYEIWCHPDAAPTVWDAVWEAGRPHGLRPCGLAALEMVRIEAGLVFAGFDFCSETDPFEAGIGFAVADKPDEFVGKAALARRRASPHRRLVGLNIDTSEPVGHGDAVFVGRTRVGVVTSATRSPILGRTIALARLDVFHADIGTDVEIGQLDGHQKRFAAAVVRFPHFDPEKLRVRG